MQLCRTGGGGGGLLWRDSAVRIWVWVWVWRTRSAIEKCRAVSAGATERTLLKVFYIKTFASLMNHRPGGEELFEKRFLGRVKSITYPGIHLEQFPGEAAGSKHRPGRSGQRVGHVLVVNDNGLCEQRAHNVNLLSYCASAPLVYSL
jgi:hypothetical protein